MMMIMMRRRTTTNVTTAVWRYNLTFSIRESKKAGLNT